MYKKPTKEQVQYAVDEGWDIEEAELGFTIFNRMVG